MRDEGSAVRGREWSWNGMNHSKRLTRPSRTRVIRSGYVLHVTESHCKDELTTQPQTLTFWMEPTCLWWPSSSEELEDSSPLEGMVSKSSLSTEGRRFWVQPEWGEQEWLSTHSPLPLTARLRRGWMKVIYTQMFTNTCRNRNKTSRDDCKLLQTVPQECNQDFTGWEDDSAPKLAAH